MRFRYCYFQEVDDKHHKFVKFKARFLSSLNHINNLGKKKRLLGKVEGWIEENIDNLYFQRKLNEPMSASVHSLNNSKKKSIKSLVYGQNEFIQKQQLQNELILEATKLAD